MKFAGQSKARRRLALALGAAWVAWPPAALAQPQGKVSRVGVLSAQRRPASLDSHYYGVFPRRMRELGYVEGGNLVIEWRFADGDYERLPGLAAALVQHKVDVILALGAPAASAAQKATTTIPIVITVALDPVGAGLVNSLARPGGNITGLTNLAVDLGVKHVELLLRVIPKLPRVAVLLNPLNPAQSATLTNLQGAANQAGIQLLSANARTSAEIPSAIATLAREKAGAVIVPLDSLFLQQAAELAAEMARHRLPSIFPNREYVEAGGLMSYGHSQVDIHRRAAGYVDRILKGAKPGELPVQQSAKLELVINNRTAKALRLSVPQSLLASADHVID